MAPPTGGGAHGPIGQERNPIMVFLLSGMCFIYGIITWFAAIKELNEFRAGRDPVNAIMIFIPILNLIMLWGLAEKVKEAKQMAGIENPETAHPFLYLLFTFYFLPAELNEVWKAAGGSPQLPPG